MVYNTEFFGRPLKIETNSLASRADSSVLISFGKTVVLGTATMSSKDVEVDFLPLSVDYEERFYAAGKIKGSRFIRREGKPSEEAVLVSRMIDRIIRPYFPKNFRREVQVILTVFAFDEENDPDFPALLAASLALLLSKIPWEGPVGGLRIAKSPKADTPILAPIYKDREDAALDVFVGGIEDISGEIVLNMIDGVAEEISEDEILSIFESAGKYIKELILLQKDIQKKEGKEKFSLQQDEIDIEKLLKQYYNEIKEKILLLNKEVKDEKILAKEKLIEKMEIDNSTFNYIEGKVLHKMVLEEGVRPDGRGVEDIRKIEASCGILPQTHGSGLFCRGLTHVLSTLTLGAPGDELLLEGMEIAGKKRFLHHYNFPPYSVGETRRLGPPGRREIGHGLLVEKAIRPLIPLTEEFPYTIRIVSEILSSNGSTSMAAVSASSLALFDAGVKIKRAAGGISCGLIIEDDLNKRILDRNYKILTDIQGPEDNLGDMDLKVAGTEKGITVIQLDVKVRGLTLQILKEGFSKAKKAREEVLKAMEKVIPSPRPKLSPLAPQILTIKINPEKIREVIGPGGKMINAIIEETEASIDIEEDGLVFVTAGTKENAQKAIDWIKNIARELKVGEIFDGKIKRVTGFGLIVDLLPNQDGLLHISEIFQKNRRLTQPEKTLHKIFKLGQVIPVRIKTINDDGKINLALLKKIKLGVKFNK